jgi:uncharacterized protein YcaQ
MARLRDGPVTTRELGGARAGRQGWWNWSEAKIAIELLYQKGEVVCTNRRGWRRVYDLPERAIPAALLAADLPDRECFDALVESSARAMGVATFQDLAEHNRLTFRFHAGAATARKLLRESIEKCGLVPVQVEGWSEQAWLHPSFEAVEARAVEHEPVLLSPFDSLLWDRRRAERLFGFQYRIEAYTPKEQRVDGYFVMALMAGAAMVGRADPVRKGAELLVAKVSLDDAGYAPAAGHALRRAAAWVGCTSIAIGSVSPIAAAPALAEELASQP